jgi:hypothetical protein
MCGSTARRSLVAVERCWRSLWLSSMRSEMLPNLRMSGRSTDHRGRVWCGRDSDHGSKVHRQFSLTLVPERFWLPLVVIMYYVITGRNARVALVLRLLTAADASPVERPVPSALSTGETLPRPVIGQNRPPTDPRQILLALADLAPAPRERILDVTRDPPSTATPAACPPFCAERCGACPRGRRGSASRLVVLPPCAGHALPAWVAVEEQTPGLLAAPLWREQVRG